MSKSLEEWLVEMGAVVDSESLRRSGGVTVERNAMGNLIVRDHIGTYIGYIDVLWPEFVESRWMQ